MGDGNYNIIVSPNFFEVAQSDIITKDTIPAYIAMSVLSCAFYSIYFGRNSINDCMEGDGGKLNTVKNKHLNVNQLSKLTEIEDEFYLRLKNERVIVKIQSIDLDELLLDVGGNASIKKLDLKKLDKELVSNHYDKLKECYSDFINKIKEGLDNN